MPDLIEPPPGQPAAAAQPTPQQAMCAAHRDRVAAGACVRCGRFVCFDCGGMTGTCPECQTYALRRLPEGAPRARWATYFLLATVAASGLGLLASALEVATGSADALTMVAGCASLVATIGAIITYCRWLHLAVRSTNAVGAQVGATPGWAVGYFFLPIANLYRPYQIINRMTAELGGEALGAPVGLWWAAWIASNVLDQIETRLTLSLLSGGASIAAAFLSIRVIRAVQREIDARRARAAALAMATPF